MDIPRLVSKVDLGQLQKMVADPEDVFTRHDLDVVLWYKNRGHVLAWFGPRDRVTYETALGLLSAKKIPEAHAVAVKAMKSGLERREATFEGLVKTIEGQKVPAPKQKALLGWLKGKKIFLYRDRDDRLRLWDGEKLSKPIGIFARAWERVSSSYAGKFVILDEARAYDQGATRKVWAEFVGTPDKNVA